jgi:hypothetical protein
MFALCCWLLITSGRCAGTYSSIGSHRLAALSDPSAAQQQPPRSQTAGCVTIPRHIKHGTPCGLTHARGGLLEGPARSRCDAVAVWLFLALVDALLGALRLQSWGMQSMCCKNALFDTWHKPRGGVGTSSPAGAAALWW